MQSNSGHMLGTQAKLLVIGHGMVGQRLLESLVAGAPDAFEISVLCEEPRPAYDRVQLSSFFSGKTAADFAAERGHAELAAKLR